METVTGKIESISETAGVSQKNGKAWTKTHFIIDGKKFSKFGKTVDKVGDVVKIEYEVSNYGNDVLTISPVTSAPGAAPEKEKKARGALDVFQHDLSVINARDKAMSHAVMLAGLKAEPDTEAVIREARVIEAYLLNREPKQDAQELQENFKEVACGLVVSRVQSSRTGKVPCQQVDRYFLASEETREAIYKMAEKTLEVKRENGFWVSLAKKEDFIQCADIDEIGEKKGAIQ